MNVLAVLVLNLGINTWGSALFDLDTVPLIFGNSTSSTCDPVTATVAAFQANFTTAYAQSTTSQALSSFTTSSTVSAQTLVNITSEAIGMTTTTQSLPSGFVMPAG